MHRSRRTLAAFAFLLAAPAAQAADRVVQVKFPEGAISTTLKGAIRGDDGVSYRFDAVAGQTMQLLFTPKNRSCYFNVFEPGADTAVHIGSTSGNEFGKALAASGTYRADVYLMRNAARRNEACRYSLSIEITGAPGGASAGMSDSMLRDACRSAAAPMYGVAPRAVGVGGPIRKAADGGFLLDGVVDKGREGRKTMRCLFKADRQLDRVMATTSDGE
ncbi:MAG: hypothetical protein U1E62_04730 [Alsobacter sp.]